MISDTLGNLEGEATANYDGGDHVIIVGRVLLSPPASIRGVVGLA